MDTPREALEDFRRLTIASARAGLYVLREEGKTEESLKTLVDTTHEQSGTMVERLNEKWDPMRRHLPVCAEGCAYCCHFSVLVAPAEALRIAMHLRETLDDAALTAVRARIAAVAEKTRDVTQEERMKMRLPCPLLEDDKCTVHEVRPGMCRAYNSCDVKACASAFESGDLRAPIPGNKGQQDGVTSVWVGMLAASTLAGLDATVVELSAALDLALAEEDATERWLSGERLFEKARTRASREGAVRAGQATQAAMKTVRELHPTEVPAAPKPAMSRNEKKRAKKKR